MSFDELPWVINPITPKLLIAKLNKEAENKEPIDHVFWHISVLGAIVNYRLHVPDLQYIDNLLHEMKDQSFSPTVVLSILRLSLRYRNDLFNWWETYQYVIDSNFIDPDQLEFLS